MVEEGGVNDLDFYLFIYLLLLMVDYGLLVVVVSGVCSAAVVVSINLWLFLNRKNERERINNVLYCK